MVTSRQQHIADMKSMSNPCVVIDKTYENIVIRTNRRTDDQNNIVWKVNFFYMNRNMMAPDMNPKAREKNRNEY